MFWLPVPDKNSKKKGRSPATNSRGRPPRKAFIKASIANVSADDYVISDEDFLDEDSEDEKPKKKGNRKRDESGSDWEMEHKNKGSKRRFESESESGSDWECDTKSDKRKKKVRIDLPVSSSHH